jgi:hypothetical protein
MLVWDETLPFSATHVSKMLYRFTMLELCGRPDISAAVESWMSAPAHVISVPTIPSFRGASGVHHQ